MIQSLCLENPENLATGLVCDLCGAWYKLKEYENWCTLQNVNFWEDSSNVASVGWSNSSVL